MLPSAEPSPSKEIQAHRPSDQRASIQSLPKTIKSSETQNHRNDWADAKNQVDYFVSAGFNHESIYNTALTPGGNYVSISPIRSSSRPDNTAKPGAVQRTYPSQELNPNRNGNLEQSSHPIRSDGSVTLPPFPPSKLQPVQVASLGSGSSHGLASTFRPEGVTSMGIGSSHGFVDSFHPEEIPSMGTGLPHSFADKFHPGNLANQLNKDFPHKDHPLGIAGRDLDSLGTGLTQELNNLSTLMVSGNDSTNSNVLDSFQLDGLGADSINPNSEETIDDDKGDTPIGPNRVSTSPDLNTKPQASQASKSQKKVKGKTKKDVGGVTAPTGMDILRGRGGLTNRHTGNMRFREEARKMRGQYRDRDTTRQEKFLLSKELVRKVKEYGGRFLERGADHLWHEMSERDARKKASQVLREEKWD